MLLKKLLQFLNKLGKVFSYLAIGLIRFYQIAISPFLTPSCRYTPTCSQYALQSYKKHNIFFATYLVIKRVLKCNPFGGYGYDPVPPKR
ncbi:MAG: membrane protein insertion efficiency factor YidD [Alphaproteobacteria bacterium]|jgi:putative membrane protein insertion efficiency factor|nr:membrane protein insertion efficiency factor YidD [Alphaproteobacteria bacterium]